MLIFNRYTGKLIYEYDKDAKINLFRLNLECADLSRANFSGATLRGINFGSADLIKANFSGASLIGVDFSGANLNGANLNGADLTGACFVGTDLRGADLTDVKGLNFLKIKQEPCDILCLKCVDFEQVQIGYEFQSYTELLREYKKIAIKYSGSVELIELVKEYLKHKEQIKAFFREGEERV